jgi:uncharacterized protein YegL
MTNTLLQNSEILFHNAKGELYHELPENGKFGILKLKIDPCPESEAVTKLQKMAIIFTIDCSASMTDYCSDKKTKLKHAIYTMKGIIKYLSEITEKNTNFEIHVAILTFSTRTKLITDFVPICSDNVDKITKLIGSIHSEDSTNIEMALHDANDMLETFHETHSDYKLYHIQLTDGEVTEGETDRNKLAAMVNPRYDNVFVGFGKHHDDQLLCKLSENPRNDYRFIDKIEYSSIVYGEILYNILYNKYEWLDIIVKNGEIYDWKTNTWGESIRVANLPYDSERIFQLRTTEYYASEVEIIVDSQQQNEAVLYCYPDLIDMETEERDTIDLTKYSFRQRTQELLYEVRHFVQTRDLSLQCLPSLLDDVDDMDDMDAIKDERTHGLQSNVEIITSFGVQSSDEKKIIRDKCSEFMKSIKEYMEKNNLKEDRMLRLLQDDIYIVFKTLYHKNGHMWCATRQISLGRDHSYQPTQFAEDDYEFGNIMNYNYNTPPTRNTPPLFADDSDMLDLQHAPRRRRQSLSNTQTLFTFPLYDDCNTPTENDTDNYEMSQNFDYNTMSPSLARTVQSVVDKTPCRI